jgi:hypothetical protein
MCRSGENPDLLDTLKYQSVPMHDAGQKSIDLKAYFKLPLRFQAFWQARKRRPHRNLQRMAEHRVPQRAITVESKVGSWHFAVTEQRLP